MEAGRRAGNVPAPGFDRLAETRNPMSRGRPSSEPRLILLVQKGRGPIWYICCHDGKNRQRLTTGTGDRREADKIFARWLLDREAEQRGGLPAGARYPHEVAIGDILGAFAEKRGPNVRFPERIGYAIKRLAEWWGDRKVDAVFPDSCNAYRDARLEQGVKLATITKELSVLRASLKWALKNNKLTSIPSVETPAPQDPKDRWLTNSEAAELLWSARKEPKSRLHLPLFVMLGLYMGARSEAILSLKWTQVDLVKGEIDFNPPGLARTKKGRAKNPIPPKLLWFLKKAHDRATSPYVLNYNGEPIKRIVHGFRNACKRGGLDGVTPHTLRHTCGTWMAQAGVPLWQIAGWLGHSDMRTTQLYAHHHPDHKKEAMAALSRHGERRRNVRLNFGHA
jgi:integrase